MFTASVSSLPVRLSSSTNPQGTPLGRLSISTSPSSGTHVSTA